MNIKKKIYEDYLKKSRLPGYNEVLQAAKENGYRMLGVLDFFNLVQEKNGNLDDEKILLNRHDIDTSPKVARKLFEIECKVYGKDGSSTYYFRDSTVDKELINDIQNYGYEAGYHYEEIAKYEKKNKLKSKEKLTDALPEIREMFLKDLEKFRISTGGKSVSVAGHGDWVNVKVGLPNTAVLDDLGTREKAGIAVEAYDSSIMDYIEERYADHVLIDDFSKSVVESINRKCKHIMILTHPRNWEVDALENSRENLKRIVESIF